MFVLSRARDEWERYCFRLETSPVCFENILLVAGDMFQNVLAICYSWEMFASMLWA